MAASAAMAKTPRLKPLDVAEQWVVATLKSGRGVVFQFNGLGGIGSVCNATFSRTPYGAVVVLSERDDNPGTSVTNAFDWIATRLRSAYLPDILPDDIRWLEHYPAHLDAGVEETIARVSLRWNAARDAYASPTWQHVNVHQPDWVNPVVVESEAGQSARPARTRNESIARGIELLRLCQRLQFEKDGVDRGEPGVLDRSKTRDAFAIDIGEAITYMAALRDLMPMQEKLAKLGRYMEAHGRLRVNYGESYADAAADRLLAEAGLGIGEASGHP